jgi:hypothetical protein
MNGDFPQTYSAEPDMTATPHGNIDELIMMSELENLMNNPQYNLKMTERGEWIFNEQGVAESIPIHMPSYAKLFELAEFGKTTPFGGEPELEELLENITHWDTPPATQSQEEIGESILERLQMGDQPGGIVSYFKPLEDPADTKFKGVGRFAGAKEYTDPDTIFIQDKSWPRRSDWVSTQPIQTVLHEAIHGSPSYTLEDQYQFGVGLGHKGGTGLDQAYFHEALVMPMLANLTKKYDIIDIRNMIDTLLSGEEIDFTKYERRDKRVEEYGGE